MLPPSDYNQDQNLCRMCDEAPAVYNGLCQLCLDDEGQDPHLWKLVSRHSVRKQRHNKEDEE